ncbi:hypothetical protein HDU92_002955 [Lobulomyces angularis]|nr:hypothetical protein HDU92_002955 [Lobulomyces angularis]
MLSSNDLPFIEMQNDGYNQNIKEHGTELQFHNSTVKNVQRLSKSFEHSYHFNKSTIINEPNLNQGINLNNQFLQLQPTQQLQQQQDPTLLNATSLNNNNEQQRVQSLKKPETVLSDKIFSAIYSGVPVFEMLCHGIAVMRRRADSFLNATQILKVAGIDKGRRTKILEKEIIQGEHEKVQGGYGKYQGTWIPFERGVELAKQYQVLEILNPILEFDPPTPGVKPEFNNRECLTKSQIKELDNLNNEINNNKPQKKKNLKEEFNPSEYVQNNHFVDSDGTPALKKLKKSANEKKNKKLEQLHGLQSKLQSQQFSHQVNFSKRQNEPYYLHNRSPYQRVPLENETFRPERHRGALMSIFLVEDPNYIPELLNSPNPPPDLDVNLVIDEQGHTSVHWASALARVTILSLLISKKADVTLRNFNGETSLIRSVLVTNNYDNQTFHLVVELLNRSIKLVDNRNRTILHHIALTAGIHGRAAAARYYLECVLERIARYDGNFADLVNVQDKNGDTALNIAARIGNKNLVEQLLEVGADVEIENRAGLRPKDFGIDCYFGFNEKKYPDDLIVEDRFDDSSVLNFSIDGLGENCQSISCEDSTSEHCLDETSHSLKNEFNYLSSCSAQSSSPYTARVMFPASKNGKSEKLDNKEKHLLKLEYPVEVLCPKLENKLDKTKREVSEKLKHKGKDSSEAIQKMIEEMSRFYISEIKTKIDSLNETQNNLRDITKELAFIRRENEMFKKENNKIPLLMTRIQNLESCLNQELNSGQEKDRKIFELENFINHFDKKEGYENEKLTQIEHENGNFYDVVGEQQKSPNSYQIQEIKLKKEIFGLKNSILEKEVKFKKFISYCAGIPLEGVGEVLDSLYKAIESDFESGINCLLLAPFLNKVKKLEDDINNGYNNHEEAGFIYTESDFFGKYHIKE